MYRILWTVARISQCVLSSVAGISEPSLKNLDTVLFLWLPSGYSARSSRRSELLAETRSCTIKRYSVFSYRRIISLVDPLLTPYY